MSNDTTLKKYIQLRKDVETAQRRADQAQGALDQLMKTLEKDYECTTLKQAKKKLKSLQTQEEKLRGEFTEAVDEFEEKWNEQLDGSEE